MKNDILNDYSLKEFDHEKNGKEIEIKKNLDEVENYDESCIAHSYKISSEISRLKSDDPVVSVPPMQKMKRKRKTG